MSGLLQTDLSISDQFLFPKEAGLCMAAEYFVLYEALRLDFYEKNMQFKKELREGLKFCT